MDVLIGALCLLALVGVVWWVVDLLLFAPARAFRRWEQRQERIARAAEQAAANRDAELGELRGKVDDLDAVAEALGRARPPQRTEQPPAPSQTDQPRLRLIFGGPDSEPPPEVMPMPPAASAPARPGPPALPATGPPFPGGRYRVNLGLPDGPPLTVWQRNLIRYLLRRAGCQPDGLDMREMTTGQAEKLVVMLGGKPKKLYTGGRAWGQRRR